MKSRPASKSVGNRYDQAVVGLALSLFAVLSLWVMVSNDQQQALGAGLGSNANVLVVGTVPTEPTIPVSRSSRLHRWMRHQPLGSMSTWLIGNEPDNREQDNQTPAAYATFYHTLYHFLKGRDPSSRVAMAPVTAVTPLRLRYLDMVLTSYQERYGTPLPVDLWTVHIYLLPEDQAWGIGIPPGLDEYAAEAVHYTVEEHDDLARFGEQLRRFRGWMAANGYREHELILSEYGILLSPHHGYDDARVRDFLLSSFAYLQQARDPATGLPRMTTGSCSGGAGLA